MESVLHFRKLAHRLAFCVFALGLAVTVCSGAFLVYRAYEHGLGEAESSFDDIERSYAPAIASSLWVLDKVLLQTQVEGIVHLPLVVYARVAFEDGEIVEAGALPQGQGLERTIRLVFSDRDENVQVGTLFVAADRAVLRQKLHAMAVDILWEQFLVSFGTAIAVLVFFYLLVGRHLKAIAAYATTVTPLTLAVPLRLARRDLGARTPDELDVLAHALNVMRETLQHAMEELRQSESRYRTLFETMQQGALLVDAEGRVTDINPAGLDILGIDREQLLGRPLAAQDLQAVDKDGASLPHAEFPSESVQNMGGAVRNMVMGVFNARTGERRWILANAMCQMAHGEKGPCPVYMTFVDITELRRLQEILIQTEKMHSIGSLAAGMAHEINNPLSAVLQAAQNLRRRLSPEQPATREALAAQGITPDALLLFLRERKIDQYLEAITEASLRAANIVRSMLDFSRRSDSAFTPCDLNQLLDRVVELASKDYDLKSKYDFRTISIVRDYELCLPVVACRSSEIEQVVLNCVVNAAHAMAVEEGNGKPSLVLRSRREQDWAVLEIEDNGPGMPAVVKNRIFEPFFTTKAPGSGTGLGLSVVYFIITRNHGGEVEVQSEPGKGTRCIIRLPLTPRQETVKMSPTPEG